MLQDNEIVGGDKNGGRKTRVATNHFKMKNYYHHFQLNSIANMWHPSWNVSHVAPRLYGDRFGESDRII